MASVVVVLEAASFVKGGSFGCWRQLIHLLEEAEASFVGGGFGHQRRQQLWLLEEAAALAIGGGKGFNCQRKQ